ncbi:MAG: twin-arginine translocase subunit TatC, partial [Prevotella sp.]|nr:twin-arginine translocase subunit TatC [Prevotella sp.]
MQKVEANNDTATFWEHLEELRFVLIKTVVATVLVGLAAFSFKDSLFSIILAPSRSDFVLFRWLKAEPFSLQMMNTQLTEQFMIHVRVALYVGIMLVSPYILYLLFAFISPALYRNER